MDAKTKDRRRIYSRFELMPYVGAASERSEKAPTSHVPDLEEDIRPTHISHLAIATGKFEAVAGWWQAVLNMKPSLDADGMRFMTFDQEHHKIVVFEVEGLQRKSGGAPEFTGMHHIAFTYASFGDLAATYKRLKKAGILPYRAINHGTSYAIDYYDPDYNCCELQCSAFPPGGAAERGPMNEWLATGAFNRSPIGVNFDMEEAIAAYAAGTDPADIVSPYRMRIGDHTTAELEAGAMEREDDDA